MPMLGRGLLPLSVEDLEEKMLKLPQVECSVIHRFGPGLYIRELHMPADTLAIGHRQKFEHMNMFLQGKIIMISEDGAKNELKAPMIFTAPSGRKMGYVVEDVVWLNVYPTTETDIETLESTYLDKSEGWLKNYKEMRLIENGRNLIDNQDYKKVLLEFGVDEKTARQQSENKEDRVQMPVGDYKFLVSDSGIEGKGVFASANIAKGESIGAVRIDGKRTPLGRFVNHSKHPTAVMKVYGSDIYLVATTEMAGCKGGFAGDEITTNYRKNLNLIGAEKCQR